MAISALVAASAAASAATLFGITSLAALGAIGLGAAAVFDYVMDSMMQDVDGQVDTMGGRLNTGKQAVADRKYVYGKARTGGTIVYQNTSGDSNQYLHNFIVFSDGRIDDFYEIYFDDVKAWGRNADGVAGFYNQYSENEDGSYSFNGNKVKLVVKVGTSNQSAFTSSTVPNSEIPAEWTNNHRLLGIAYAYVRLEFDPEIYPNGMPNITAIIKGKRHYDPRLDSSQTEINGNGSHDVDDKDTYTYTNNAAVCLLNYMLDDRIGLGESITAFDLPALKTAMDICDENVFGANNMYTGTTPFIVGDRYRITNVGTDVDWASMGAPEDPEINDIFTATTDGLNAGTSGRCQKVYYKYTCDGIISSKNSHENNIRNMLTSMNGQLLYSSGKYVIKAYAYEEPHSQIVTEDMIIGGFEVATKASRKNMYNRVKGKFNSASHNYVLTEYPVQSFLSDDDPPQLTFEQDDGEILYHEQNLPFTTQGSIAQRLARLTMLRSRMQNTIKFTANAKALVYTVGDNIKVANSTIGYSESDPKIYQIQRLNIKPDTKNGIVVDIEAKENSEGIYTWDTNDEEAFSTGTVIDLVDPKPNPITIYNIQAVDPNMPNHWLLQFVEPENPPECFYRIRFNYPAYTGIPQRVIEITSNGSGVVQKHIPFTYAESYLNIQITFEVVNPLRGHITAQSADPLIFNSKGYDGYGSNIVEGTIANPTQEQVAEIIAESGLQLNFENPVTYLVVDSNRNVLDSIQFLFSQDVLDVTFANTLNKIYITPQGSFFHTNGDFNKETAFWATTGNVEITGGKLVFTNAGESDLAQTMYPAEVGTGKITPNVRYRFSFSASNATTLDSVIVKIYESRTGGFVEIASDDFANNGNHQLNFTPLVATALAIVIHGDSSGNTNISLDDFKFEVLPEKAEAVATIDVIDREAVLTATLVDSEGVTNTDQFNVTTTGFGSSTTQAKIALEMPREYIDSGTYVNNNGTKKLVYEVKAEYEAEYENTDGTTFTLTNQHVEEVILEVEVVDNT